MKEDEIIISKQENIGLKIDRALLNKICGNCSNDNVACEVVSLEQTQSGFKYDAVAVLRITTNDFTNDFTFYIENKERKQLRFHPDNGETHLMFNTSKIRHILDYCKDRDYYLYVTFFEMEDGTYDVFVYNFDKGGKMTWDNPKTLENIPPFGFSTEQNKYNNYAAVTNVPIEWADLRKGYRDEQRLFLAVENFVKYKIVI